MRIIDRLDEYMERKHINDNQITVNCSLSVGLLGKARKEGNDLGKKAIEKILSFYQDLDRVWILTGEGCMIKTEQSLSEVNNRTILVSAEAWDVIKKQADSLASKDRQVEDLITLLKKANALKEEHAIHTDTNRTDIKEQNL